MYAAAFRETIDVKSKGPRLEATVRAKQQGPRGWYAIAESGTVEGSITFSLKPPTWNDAHPEPRDVVVLTRLRKNNAGWRAERARFLHPADEQ